MGAEEGQPEILPPEMRAAATELVWRCFRCGHLLVRRNGPPQSCPSCDAPREEFYLVTED